MGAYQQKGESVSESTRCHETASDGATLYLDYLSVKSSLLLWCENAATGAEGRWRATLRGGDIYGDRSDPSNYFNKTAFAIPTDPSQPFGNLGRNVARSSGFWQADLGIYKEFPLPREGSRVEFRSEFFNLLNRTNFQAASQSFSPANFGVISSTFLARQILFAIKLYW